ncbi:MAG: hypothetical protein FVQ85_21005 [Planctomycetes bacterium]|nr:hypothetical protein [Planctomycetota bacterium]
MAKKKTQPTKSKKSRLVIATEYLRDLKKPVTVDEATKLTNRTYLKSGGSDNLREQKYYMHQTITVMETLGMLKRGEDGAITPVRRKR